ncbi:patatin [Stylonychia lemnae]|uniref:Patatin n=1 Tax=Stylonychia lemnae TaxID=5949 RepID=A0A078AQU5_STYLE|nr:patatin [Stylonychia lemnae]|eukprot:CDW84800.1 patatin [Stylonychia lemnae]
MLRSKTNTLVKIGFAMAMIASLTVASDMMSLSSSEPIFVVDQDKHLGEITIVQPEKYLNLAAVQDDASSGSKPAGGSTASDDDQPDHKHYNILSIDGGGIRGIIPTVLIQYIETESYAYARNMSYIKEDSRGIIEMKDLFDMVAGTSTGGLITTALVTPKEVNSKEAYNASFVMSIFEDKGAEIFKSQSINKGLLGIMITIMIMIGGVLGYRLGKNIFANQQVEDTNYKLRHYIKEAKKTAKHDDKMHDSETKTSALGSQLLKHMSVALTKKVEQIHYELIPEGQKLQELVESHDYWKIKEAERLLQEREGKYRESKQKKWIFCVFGLILGGALGYYIPVAVYYLGNSNYNRTVIDTYLKSFFGHAKVSDILTDECLIVAYSYNAQQPRFYSKYEVSKDPQIYDVGLDIAAGGSSAAPGYFDPKVFENGRGETEVLVDGGIIANNPSMYAFIFASEMNKKKNIRVVSIGTGQVKQPMIDPDNVSILTWVENLGDLIVDVEVTAHAYFTEFLAGKYHRYQVETELPLDAADGESIKALKKLGNNLLEQEKENLDILIRELVEERLSPKAKQTAK